MPGPNASTRPGLSPVGTDVVVGAVVVGGGAVVALAADFALADSALAPATSRAPRRAGGHGDERSDGDTSAALTSAAGGSELLGDGGHLSSVRHDGRRPHRPSGSTAPDGARVDAIHRTTEARTAIWRMWAGWPPWYLATVTDWWRRRPPVVQDLLAGGAVAVAWFTAFHLFRQHGWSPRQPETFVVAGIWTAAVVALRRVQPAWVFAVVVVVYPLAYGGELQSEFHLLPVLVVGYTATSSGRVHPVVASIGCMAANLVLFWNHDLGAPGRALRSRPFDWPSVLFIELATVSVVVLGWLMHRQAEISRDLAQRNAELERLRAAEAQRVIAQERTRIARASCTTSSPTT